MNATAPLEIIILAAGDGTRMRASLPKPLHRIGGMPMLAHVLTATTRVDAHRIHIVVGDRQAEIQRALATHTAAIAESGVQINWVRQPRPTGTGDAVRRALQNVADAAQVLVLYADMPLVRARTVAYILNRAPPDEFVLVTMHCKDPSNYGRVVRDDAGRVVKIVEHRDAVGAELNIKLCNTGVVVAAATELKKYTAQLNQTNARGEFYLTDTVALAAADGMAIKTISQWSGEMRGVNSLSELAAAERDYQWRAALRLLKHGVVLRDPARLEVRGTAEFGRDCVVDVNVILAGEVTVGDGVHIGANCIIRDSDIGANCVIEPNSIIERARLGEYCRIGPFARLRPDTRLGDRVVVGNFVEIKDSELGDDARMKHLAYAGDAAIGAGANIGAGAITCNYDGAHKHRTAIGAGAFIGANAALVAPVEIGAGSVVGAGSVIAKNVPADAVAVTRAEQKNLPRRKPAADDN